MRRPDPNTTTAPITPTAGTVELIRPPHSGGTVVNAVFTSPRDPSPLGGGELRPRAVIVPLSSN
jgi:hypothetical protein